ncbi:hypothetical protein M4D81_32305 [Paenibacillus sp. p3-SID867]|uniref:hypothetical protein n=1 Tax=Paenibacillus sp. p3-SID867 TaxID=2916363 RepID=UPI0021A37E3D|nr:hypothetical protein [Paenibacillus sp. p3-SID867]MCT1403692.1 hypothetical protein [Paenibacillus sp. p3-SID867]
MSIPIKPFKSQFSKFDYFIIGLTYVFFPLALIIAGFRILPTQQHHCYRGRNARLMGWVLFGSYIMTSVIFLLASETSEEFLNDNLAMALCLLVPAMLLLVAADLADKKFRKLLRIYAEAVLQRRLIYINHIAIAANQTPSHVVRDLNFMIKERMLPYGKIENGVLMITSLHRESVKPAEIQQDIGSKSVECSGCGARTVISHQEEKECEYCGTIIVA